MIRSYQGLRVVAILFVFMTHAHGFGLWNEDRAYLCCMWSLTFFFALSGFLTGYRDDGRALTGRSWAAAFARRLVKIYPLYFLVMISGHRFLRGVACLLAGNDPCAAGIWDGWPFAHFLLVQSWFPWTYEHFLPLGWFLSTLLFLYLVGDAVVPLLRKLGTAGLLAVALGGVCASVGLSFALSRTGLPFREWSQIFPPSRVPEYVAMVSFGLLCARKNLHAPESSGFWAATLAEALAVGLLVGAMVLPWDWTAVDIRWILPTAFLLLATLPGRGILSRFLGCRAMVALGGLTLPVYLCHTHVLKTVVPAMKAVGLPWDSAAVRASGFFVSLVVVYAFACGYAALVRRLKERKVLA